MLDHVVDFYDSEIAWADQALGQLLEELEALSDTVVVVTADHGEEFGDHGQYEHGHSLYNELLRVPLIVRLPGGRHAGNVVDEPVGTIDVAPTLLHLAGAEPLPEAEGRPLFATGAGERPARRPKVTARLRDNVRGFLAENAHGLHVRCRTASAGSLRLEVTSTATFAHVQPLAVEEDDAFEIDTTRRRLEVSSEADATDDWWILRLLEPDAQLVFRADSAGARPPRGESEGPARTRFFVGGATEPAGERTLTVRLGDEALAGAVSPLPAAEGPWCRIWQVSGAAPASSEALDSEIVDQLRALGYL